VVGDCEKTVIMKQGLAIELSGKEFTCCKKCGYLCSLLFVVMTAGFIYLEVIIPFPDSVFVFGFHAFFYLAYQIFASETEAREYLSNTLSIDQTFQDIQKAIESAPICILKIGCYHVVTERDSDGNTSTRDVYTHRAEEPFSFSGWVDISPPASTIDYLRFLKLSRLHIDEIVEMDPNVRARYKS
jgi:hypothetical protein